MDIQKLKLLSSKDTCMISYIMPITVKIEDAIAKIVAEKSTSENIKSKSNRKKVADALINIKNVLTAEKKAIAEAKTGFAIYAGYYRL